MKYSILLIALLSSNAMADFDSEWAKFDKDFAVLRQTRIQKSNPVIDQPKPNKELADVNTDTNILEQVNPLAPERLGNTLENKEMKNKVQSLYKKPETVVYSVTLD